MTEVGDTEFGLQVGIGFLGKVVTAVAGLLGSIIVARIVGPAGYGIFYISVAISQFLENPITGWGRAAKKRMTETDFDTAEALGSVLLGIVVVVVVGGPASFLVLSVVSQNPVIPLAVPFLFVTTASYWALNTFLSGRENFSMSIWSGAVSTIIQVVGKIALVVLGFGVWGMVGGHILGPILIFPLLLRWINVRPAMPSMSTLRSVASYAKWSIPEGFLGTALSRMDMILLGLLASASVAGKYQVGLQLTMPAVFISGVIGRGLMGRVSNLDSRDEAWTDDLWNSLSYGSMLAVPIFFGSLVLGEQLAVTVFGSQYSGAGVFVVGLAGYHLVKTQLSPFRSVIDGLDRPDLAFGISLVTFVLNVALGVGLWFVAGAVGIVAATVVSGVVTYTLSVFYVRRLADVGFLWTRPFRTQVLSGAVMAGVVYVGMRVFGVHGPLYVVGYLLVGGLVYGSLELALSPHLLETARGIWADFRAAYFSTGQN